jgi:hypothetical protein
MSCRDIAVEPFGLACIGSQLMRIGLGIGHILAPPGVK